MRRAKSTKVELDHGAWAMCCVAAGGRLWEILRESLPDLYAYLSKETANSFNDLDGRPLRELCEFANAVSRMNERSAS